MTSSDQVLSHNAPQLPIKFECDASTYRIGAMLSHVMEDETDIPIVIVSRSLSSAEHSYAHGRRSVGDGGGDASPTFHPGGQHRNCPPTFQLRTIA